MTNLMTADEIYNKHKAAHADYDHHLVMEWREKMPHDFARHMYREEYGCHIFDEELYNDATAHFVNPDGSHGPHWSVPTIKAKSGIASFEEKEFTLHDYAYVVNMLYSDYGNIFSEPSLYLRMAKSYLTDSDYYGNPAERAYHDAIKRIDYFS